MANDRQQRAARAEQMRKERAKADKKQRNLITLGIVGVVAVLVVLAGFAITSIADENAKSDELVQPANTNDDYGIVYDAAAAGDDAADADGEPVTVQIYEDFLCPGCGAFEAAAGDFLQEAVASGEIQVEYRPYAFLLQQSSNEYSQRAWNAAACVVDAGGPSAFKQYHDALFANQPQEGTAGPEDPELVAMAEDVGVTGIESCVRQEKFTPWIEDAREQGTDDGVRGTPTVRVDGEDVDGPNGTIPGPRELQAAIDAAKAA